MTKKRFSTEINARKILPSSGENPGIVVRGSGGEAPLNSGGLRNYIHLFEQL
jgi:hypothetical protein